MERTISNNECNSRTHAATCDDLDINNLGATNVPPFLEQPFQFLSNIFSEATNVPHTFLSTDQLDDDIEIPLDFMTDEEVSHKLQQAALTQKRAAKNAKLMPLPIKHGLIPVGAKPTPFQQAKEATNVPPQQLADSLFNFQMDIALLLSEPSDNDALLPSDVAAPNSQNGRSDPLPIEKGDTQSSVTEIVNNRDQTPPPVNNMPLASTGPSPANQQEQSPALAVGNTAGKIVTGQRSPKPKPPPIVRNIKGKTMEQLAVKTADVEFATSPLNQPLPPSPIIDALPRSQKKYIPTRDKPKRMCKFVNSPKGCTNSKCTFSHSDEDLIPTTPLSTNPIVAAAQIADEEKEKGERDAKRTQEVLDKQDKDDAKAKAKEEQRMSDMKDKPFFSELTHEPMPFMHLIKSNTRGLTRPMTALIIAFMLLFVEIIYRSVVSSLFGYVVSTVASAAAARMPLLAKYVQPWMITIAHLVEVVDLILASSYFIFRFVGFFKILITDYDLEGLFNLTYFGQLIWAVFKNFLGV